MLDKILTSSGLKDNLSWRQFWIRWMLISLLLHIAGAMGSAGFYHADEHFQILEFVNFKLGRSVAQELPLEFGHQLRPWLVPALFLGFTKGLISLGIENPFLWSCFLRLFSAGVGWLSTLGLTLCTYLWIPQANWRRRAVIASVLLWYFPGFHARPSSENLGGAFFFIGTSILTLTLSSQNKTRAAFEKWALFLVGIFFGLAFESRFQVGFFILGALLWLLCIARVSIKGFLWITLGMLIPLTLGTLADYWGYGRWVFTPWNYLNYNIIQNHVADMDASPWWDYFRRAITESWPILGILLLCSFIFAWIRNPKHILTWSCGAFFLIHEIIGHKELRFLFPLLHAGGILLCFAIMPWKSALFKINDLLKNVLKPVLISLFVMNGFALSCFIWIPAWMPIRFYSQLYEFSQNGLQIYLKDESLFNFGGAIMNFYRPPKLKVLTIKEYSDFSKVLENGSEPHWLFYSRFKLPDDAENLRPYCSPEFSTLPRWIEKTPIRNRLQQVTNWTLFRCQK